MLDINLQNRILGKLTLRARDRGRVISGFLKFHLAVKYIELIPLAAVTILVLWAAQGHAAEGDYSNYVPGTFGDFAAVETATNLTIRNDVYYYSADVSSR